jgi:Flp pilus assembly protein TadD
LRPSKGTRDAHRGDAVLVFLLALAAGSLNAWFLKDVPFLSHPIIDAAEYIAGARALVAGLPFWEEVPIHGPLYSLFLVPFVRFAPASLGAIYAFQILLVACAAVLIRSVGTRLGGRVYGNVSGALVAAAPPILYFEVQVLPVVLQIFLHALLLRTLVGRGERNGRLLFTAGLFGGLSYATHPGSGLFLLLILVFLLAGERPRSRALLYLAGLLLPLLPISALNARAGGDFLPVTGNAGLNLYVGNGPESDGTAHIRPGYEWERLRALPRLAGREGSSEESRFFLERTAGALRSDPSAFGRGLAAKALLYATGFPIDASQDPVYFRERSPLLKLSFLDAGVLVPVAFAFLLTGAAWSRTWMPVVLGFLGSWAGTALTVFAIRYRAPVWPFLVLLAGAPFLHASRGTRVAVVRGVAAAAALLLLAQADPFGFRGRNPVRTEYNLARLERERGNLGEARDLFESLWRRTSDPDAANGLGVVEMSNPGGDERALAGFREALRVAPDYADARFNAALALAHLGREGEAEEMLGEAIRLSPGHAPALYMKGVLLGGRGDLAESERFTREALRADPTRDDAWTTLGVLRARAGALEEAESCFRRAIRLNPSSRDARDNMSRLNQMRGSPVPR